MTEHSSTEPRRRSDPTLAHPATSLLPPRSSDPRPLLPEPSPVRDDSPMEASWTFLDRESLDLSLIPSPSPSALPLHSDDIPFDAIGGDLVSPSEVPVTTWLVLRAPTVGTLGQELSMMSTEESDSYVDPKLMEALEREQEGGRDRHSTLVSSLSFGHEDGPLTSTPPRRSHEDLKSASLSVAGRATPPASPSFDPPYTYPASPPSPDTTSFRTAGGLASGTRGSQAHIPSQGWDGSTKPGSNQHSTPREQHHFPSSSHPPSNPSLAARRSHVEPPVLRPASLSSQTSGFKVESLSPRSPPYSTYRPPFSPSSSTSPLDSHTHLPAVPPRSLSAGDLVALQHTRPVSPAREQAHDHPVVDVARLVPLSRSSAYSVVDHAPRQLENLPTPPPSSPTSYRRSISPHKAYDPPRLAFSSAPPLTPPPSGASNRQSILRGSYPFPSAPPAIPLPAPPSFTCVYLDPSTNTVPPSPSLPRTPRSSLRPARTTQPASTTLLPVQIVERDESEENANSLGRTSERSMHQRFLDWSRQQGATETDADRPMNELLLRSVGVETKLGRGATASEGERERHGTSTGQFRLRRTTSMTSKWSFGILGSSRENTPEGCSRVANEEGDRRASKRVRKEEREKEKEKKRVIDSRRKTQEWLAGISMGDAAGLKEVKKPWWRFRRGHRRRPSHKPLFSSRRVRILLLVGVALVGATIALILFFTLSRRESTIGTCVCENEGKAVVTRGECSCVCRGDWGGSFCHLDTTCANPSGVRGQTIAQGLLDIAAHANTLFSPAIDPSRLAFVVNNYLGISTNASRTTCEAQLALVSLPHLPPSSFANRLAWTSAAVLWSAAMSESNATGLLGFANSKTFDALGDVATKPNSNFQKIAGGYIWDLAAMTIAVPPTTWITQTSPSTRQTLPVSSIPEVALNRMNGFALASSTQRATALSHHWAELGLVASDLVLFKAAVAAAPVVVPFDATSVFGGQDAFTLAASQTANTSFPPAVGCLPVSSAGQAAAINSVEVTAFGLEAVSSSAVLDTVCLDRPLYGVLNFLNLRLPFADSDTRPTPRQGIVLVKDNKARMTLHAGELLVGSLAGPFATPSTPSLPDRFGTFERLDHVLLDFLRLLSPELAQELVAFVLGQPPIPVPPLPSSALYQASNGLASLPIIEVALWGGLRYTNIDHVVSGLAVPGDDSTLFFGSAAGSEFRAWALQGPANTASRSAIQWSLRASGAAALADGTLALAATSTLGSVWSAAGDGSTSAVRVWSELGGV